MIQRRTILIEHSGGDLHDRASADQSNTAPTGAARNQRRKPHSKRGVGSMAGRPNTSCRVVDFDHARIMPTGLALHHLVGSAAVEIFVAKMTEGPSGTSSMRRARAMCRTAGKRRLLLSRSTD